MGASLQPNENALNNLAHRLNENFILRLYAVLESNGMYRSKLDQNLPGYDEMDIVRRLRNMIGHGSEFDAADSGKKKLYDRAVGQVLQADRETTPRVLERPRQRRAALSAVPTPTDKIV